MAERVLVEWLSVGISWNGAALILASGKTEPPEPPARPDARCWWCQYKTQTSPWMQRAATPPEGRCVATVLQWFSGVFPPP